MNDEPRVYRTGPQANVAAIFVGYPGAEFCGAELTRQTDILPGTLYPMLSRWRASGLLSDRWETDDEYRARAGRKGPKFRYYRLTELGAVELTKLCS